MFGLDGHWTGWNRMKQKSKTHGHIQEPSRTLRQNRAVPLSYGSYGSYGLGVRPWTRWHRWRRRCSWRPRSAARCGAVPVPSGRCATWATPPCRATSTAPRHRIKDIKGIFDELWSEKSEKWWTNMDQHGSLTSSHHMNHGCNFTYRSFIYVLAWFHTTCNEWNHRRIKHA